MKSTKKCFNTNDICHLLLGYSINIKKEISIKVILKNNIITWLRSLTSNEFNSLFHLSLSENQLKDIIDIYKKYLVITKNSYRKVLWMKWVGGNGIQQINDNNSINLQCCSHCYTIWDYIISYEYDHKHNEMFLLHCINISSDFIEKSNHEITIIPSFEVINVMLDLCITKSIDCVNINCLKTLPFFTFGQYISTMMIHKIYCYYLNFTTNQQNYISTQSNSYRDTLIQCLYNKYNCVNLNNICVINKSLIYGLKQTLLEIFDESLGNFMISTTSRRFNYSTNQMNFIKSNKYYYGIWMFNLLIKFYYSNNNKHNFKYDFIDKILSIPIFYLTTPINEFIVLFGKNLLDECSLIISNELINDKSNINKCIEKTNNKNNNLKNKKKKLRKREKSKLSNKLVASDRTDFIQSTVVDKSQSIPSSIEAISINDNNVLIDQSIISESLNHEIFYNQMDKDKDVRNNSIDATNTFDYDTVNEDMASITYDSPTSYITTYTTIVSTTSTNSISTGSHNDNRLDNSNISYVDRSNFIEPMIYESDYSYLNQSNYESNIWFNNYDISGIDTLDNDISHSSDLFLANSVIESNSLHTSSGITSSYVDYENMYGITYTHMLSEASRSVLMNKLAIYRNMITQYESNQLVIPNIYQPMNTRNARTYHDDIAQAYNINVSESNPSHHHLNTYLHRYPHIRDYNNRNNQSYSHLNNHMNSPVNHTINRNVNEAMSESGDRNSRHGNQSHLSVRALLPLQPLQPLNNQLVNSYSKLSVASTTNLHALVDRSFVSSNKIVSINKNKILSTVQSEMFKEHLNIANDYSTNALPINIINNHFNDVYNYSLSQVNRSKLSQDIMNYIQFIDESSNLANKAKLESYNKLVNVVKGLWPRSQVKLFGSFVTGLSIPSSDLDMVICLPKVQVEAGPEAPGVLEGRNAIKETWQQNLFRCLCKEEWVYAESIKVIGNTAVPVLKLKTKELMDDSGYHLPSISLDISFEGPAHKGLEATKLILSILKKYLPLRSLVLMLKMLLTHRSLCEAYTGGLSSYAIFLLSTRYLQELEISNKNIFNLEVYDLGSLLIGFLRFYGENFDPRTTGINIIKRCYYPRVSLSNAVPISFQSNNIRHTHVDYNYNNINENIDTSLNSSANQSFRYLNANDRRHSFNGPNNVFYNHPSAMYGPGPYKFDPICIDDPLENGNNVGRNCFRILQVQKCFNVIVNRIDHKLNDIINNNNAMNSIYHIENDGILNIILGEDIDLT